jgi:DNA-binding transcriptional LysR family regulator
VDTRQLRYFLAVNDQGSFTRAAELLDISQPSLSRAIAGFEHELGVVLFHRVGRAVLPTPAGSHLLIPARRVIRGLDAARASIDALKGLGWGRLEITTMASPGIEPLTTLLRLSTARYPDIEVILGSAVDPEDVLHAVRTGVSEIGLLGAVTPATADDLVIIPVEEQGLILITTDLGDLAGRHRITAQDLAGRRLITAQRGSLIHRFVADTMADGVDVTVAVDVRTGGRRFCRSSWPASLTRSCPPGGPAWPDRPEPTCSPSIRLPGCMSPWCTVRTRSPRPRTPSSRPSAPTPTTPT